MFVITTAQIRNLAQAQERAFMRKALQLLSQKCPDSFTRIGVRKENEEKVICDAIAAAKSYNIRFESDLLLYIECMLQLGINFDKNPNITWTRKILNDPTLSGETKMNMITEHLVFSSMKDI